MSNKEHWYETINNLLNEVKEYRATFDHPEYGQVVMKKGETKDEATKRAGVAHEAKVAKAKEAAARKNRVHYRKEIDTTDPKLHKALEDHNGGSFEHFNRLKHSHNEEGHAVLHASVTHSYSKDDDLGLDHDTDETYSVKVVKHPKEGYKVSHYYGR